MNGMIRRFRTILDGMGLLYRENLPYLFFQLDVGFFSCEKRNVKVLVEEIFFFMFFR